MKRKTRIARNAAVAEPYQERDAILRSLGFGSYKEYLRSMLWQVIRQRVLAASPACYGCGNPAKQVHHTRYTVDVLAGHDDSTLRSVCGGCHKTAEFWFGRKQHLTVANDNLKKKRKRQIKNKCWEQRADYRALWRQKKDAMRKLTGSERREAISSFNFQMREIRREMNKQT